MIRKHSDGTIVAEGEGVTIYQILALKGAVKLESLGLKHSSGKSARAHACRLLGISTRTPAAQVIEALLAKAYELNRKEAETAILGQAIFGDSFLEGEDK